MEVRNITPNYTNNATTFGMAFKKPNADLMEEFTEFVTKKGRNSARMAKRGVSKIIDKHAKDKHFDFVYTEGGEFHATPLSSKAEKFISSGSLSKEADVKAPEGIVEKLREKYFNEAYKAQVDNASGFKGFWLTAKSVAAVLKSRIALEFKPVDALPRKLRDASATISALEDTINKQIAKELKESKIAEKAALKKAKADAKKLAAKEKAIDKIGSVF